LILTPEVSRCEIRWGDDRRMILQRTGLHAPSLHRLDTFRETCTEPQPDAHDRLTRAFYANTALAQTCATSPGPIDFAIDPLDALNARIEALTGRSIARADLQSGDPDIRIDFSRAPKLDLIIMSYLHIRADLSGHLLRRMIEYHAARGTRVRILTSATLMLDLDRTYWESLAARHPNVQLQYFEWNPQGPDMPTELVDMVQRSNHTKLFLTLAAAPGKSRFITGGRNLHDGFFYDDAFDFSGHPELRSYAEGGIEGLAWHSVYFDFEIVMRGDAAVRQVARHFSTLWHRDSDGAVPVPMARAGDTGPLPRDGQARHFISYPWADGRALEQSYVALIDAASQEILAVSPFLYPPPSIVAALKRAEARGVRVVLVTRINSTDPPGYFTTALNHAFLNANAGSFERWNYEPDGHLMHSKLLVIDRRLSVVSSTNLNRRSFLHDTENGVTFLDRGMANRLADVVESYTRDGEQITGHVPSTGLMRAVASLRAIWQYF
jgi:phosphatidylserine/phosphatidylglycerophosphate/cardiolipin synthase-like enzyme